MALDPPPTPAKGAPQRPAGTLSPDSAFARPEPRAASPARRTERAPSPPTVVQPLNEPARGLAALIRKPLPWIGGRPLQQQVQVLGILMGLFLVFTVIVIYVDATLSSHANRHVARAADMQTQSQRLARVAPAALMGQPDALKELQDARDQIDLDLLALLNGDPATGAAPAGQEQQPLLQQLQARWKASEDAASFMLAQRKALLGYGDLAQKISDSAPHMNELAEAVLAARLGGASREAGEAGQLLAATRGVALDSAALVAVSGPSGADAAAALARDIGQFHDTALALFSASDGDSRARLAEMLKTYRDVLAPAAEQLASGKTLAQAKESARSIVAGSEPLRQSIAAVLAAFSGEQRGRTFDYAMMAIFGVVALLCGLAVAKVLLEDSRRRAGEAEQRLVDLQRLEDQGKRRNERNQAAILRLMNELQEVADGNLTVQATVTEDITGAIADSVNYTVEELRGLVGRINSTAEQVNTSSTQARDIATRLLTASESQSREIRGTGEKVLQMAQQINEVSNSAGESAKVARNSLEAAERGQRAAYNQIAGMNEIREHIQDTAKRIKRLGESSQEIGEIVELITDITEQTNVLALNAAIQAAAAGEAGRGFSVVAEEVQRLADRSAEAAKQIGALIRTIQTDTQDAVTAMERSTQGVVEGTKLSDAAGTALAEIGRVSRQLAELIERIATTTSEQASSAGGVAVSMERILSVTEQTSQGTRQTAQSIGQLATLARELKASVARFRVA